MRREITPSDIDNLTIGCYKIVRVKDGKYLSAKVVAGGNLGSGNEIRYEVGKVIATTKPAGLFCYDTLSDATKALEKSPVLTSESDTAILKCRAVGCDISAEYHKHPPIKANVNFKAIYVLNCAKTFAKKPKETDVTADLTAKVFKVVKSNGGFRVNLYHNTKQIARAGAYCVNLLPSALKAGYKVKDVPTTDGTPCGFKITKAG